MSGSKLPQALEQPGLEYYPGHHAAYPQPQYLAPPTYAATKEGESGGLGDRTSNKTTILGLRRTTFWLLAVLALVVIAAAVGGGVGGSLAAKNAKSNSDKVVIPSPSSSGTINSASTATSSSSFSSTINSASTATTAALSSSSLSPSTSSTIGSATTATAAPSPIAGTACTSSDTYCGWYLGDDLGWSDYTSTALYYCNAGGLSVNLLSECVGSQCEGPTAHCGTTANAPPSPVAGTACRSSFTYCGWYLGNDLGWSNYVSEALYYCNADGVSVSLLSECVNSQCEGPVAHCG
ncbi:hypothetical protein BU16DRAFT_200948 [Lophium mytilinum]|uniref:Uncharacterized protein n=1 Tax=Lophium mytilinum TaxID=390894 RepID=A0A6A6RDG5_9PEZI|nr:hypothetical protein BU16DRAFT_200948 [Lophium mytilinum]